MAPERHDGDGHDHGHDHAHGHAGAHDHAHDHAHAPAAALRTAFWLTAGFMVVEAVGGVLSGSLALLSDAGHMLTDAGALALALGAQRLAARERTRLRTFGFRRAEMLAALLNGLVLGGTAVWVVVEAVRRLGAPPEVRGGWMLAVAGLGLAVNLAAAWVLGHAHGHHNANVRAATAHVLADAAGSVAALVAGALVTGLGWRLADPIASMAISLLILIGAWKLVRGSAEVLMEGVPPEVDVDAVERTIRGVAGVADLHDLHVWSISEGFPVVTVHVVLASDAHGVDVARRVGQELEREHGLHHVTVQPEAGHGPSLIGAGRLVRGRLAPGRGTRG